MAFTWSNKPSDAGQISARTILEIRQNLDAISNSYGCSSANGTVVCTATAGNCTATAGSCSATTSCSSTNSSQYIPNDGYCSSLDSSKLSSECDNCSYNDMTLCSWDYGAKDARNCPADNSNISSQ